MKNQEGDDHARKVLMKTLEGMRWDASVLFAGGNDEAIKNTDHNMGVSIIRNSKGTFRLEVWNSCRRSKHAFLHREEHLVME